MSKKLNPFDSDSSSEDDNMTPTKPTTSSFSFLSSLSSTKQPTINTAYNTTKPIELTTSMNDNDMITFGDADTIDASFDLFSSILSPSLTKQQYETDLSIKSSDNSITLQGISDALAHSKKISLLMPSQYRFNTMPGSSSILPSNISQSKANMSTNTPNTHMTSVINNDIDNHSGFQLSEELYTLIPNLESLLQHASKHDDNLLSTLNTRALESILGQFDDSKQEDELESIVQASIDVSKKKHLIETNADGSIQEVQQSQEAQQIQHTRSLMNIISTINSFITHLIPVQHQHDIYTPHSKTINLSRDEVNSMRISEKIQIKLSDGLSPFADQLKPITSWDYCGFSHKILKCLRAYRYNTPFSVQKHVLPLIMKGSDVICCAKTGSGKTLAFVLPMIRYVATNKYDVNYSKQGYHWEKNKYKPQFDDNGYQIISDPFFDEVTGELVDYYDDFDGDTTNKSQYMQFLEKKRKAAKGKTMLWTSFQPETSTHLTLYHNNYNTSQTTITINHSTSPHGLILVPTRELAVQIETEVKKFTNHLISEDLCINTLACFGGQPLSHDVKIIKNFPKTVMQKQKDTTDEDVDAINARSSATKHDGSRETIDILISTPGRLIELLGADGGKVLNLLNVGFFVVDEADRLFDLGFEPQLDLILKAMPTTTSVNIVEENNEYDEDTQNKRHNGSDGNRTSTMTTLLKTETTTTTSIPIAPPHHPLKHKTTAVLTSRRQTLLFSATFPHTIERLARRILYHPIELHVSENKASSNIIQCYLATIDYTPTLPSAQTSTYLDPTSIQCYPNPLKPTESTPFLPDFNLTDPLSLLKTPTIPQPILQPSLFSIIPFPPLPTHQSNKFSALLQLIKYWYLNETNIWFYQYYLTLFQSYPGVTITPILNPTNSNHVISYKVLYTPPSPLITARNNAFSHNETTPNASLNTISIPTTIQTIDFSEQFNNILLSLPRLAHRGKVIIFVDSKAQVDTLVLLLQRCGIPALHVHGDQPQIDRDDYIDKFKNHGCAPIWDKSFNQLNVLNQNDQNTDNNTTNNSNVTPEGQKNDRMLQCPSQLVPLPSQSPSPQSSMYHYGPVPNWLLPQYNAIEPINQCDVLIATSILSRGIDVPSLSLVVNYDIPSHFEDYIHRVGRTGRGGNSGYAVTMFPYATPPTHIREILMEEDKFDRLPSSRPINPATGEYEPSKLDRFQLDLFAHHATEQEKVYSKQQGMIFSILNQIIWENYKLESGDVKKTKRGGKAGKKDTNANNNQNTTTTISTGTKMADDIDALNNINTTQSEPNQSEPKQPKFFFTPLSLLNSLPLPLSPSTGYFHVPRPIMYSFLLSKFQVFNQLVKYDELQAYKSAGRGLAGQMKSTAHQTALTNAHYGPKKRPRPKPIPVGTGGLDSEGAEITPSSLNTTTGTSQKQLSFEERERLRKEELRQRYKLRQDEEKQAKTELEHKNALLAATSKLTADNSFVSAPINALVLASTDSTHLVEKNEQKGASKMWHQQSANQNVDNATVAARMKLQALNQAKTHYLERTIPTHMYSMATKSVLTKSRQVEWTNMFNIAIEKKGDASIRQDVLVIRPRDSKNPNCHTKEQKQQDEKNNVERAASHIYNYLEQLHATEKAEKQAKALMR